MLFHCSTALFLAVGVSSGTHRIGPPYGPADFGAEFGAVPHHGIRFDRPWRPPFAAMEHSPNISIPLDHGLPYLRDMLQTALQVEHGTIPLYLTALYSIQDAGAWHANLIRGVAIEEMLHMTVAANVLNAIGGHPDIDRPGFVPHFPELLPLLNISVDLAPFTKQSALNFREIERPLPKELLPKVAMGESISAFYHNAMMLLESLVQQHGEKAVFVGDPKLQVGADCGDTCGADWHTPRKVTTLQEAIDGLMDISEQGAGVSTTNISAGPFGGGIAHFARFQEIYVGKLYRHNDTADSGPTGAMAAPINFSAVFDFHPNPAAADHPAGSKERAALSGFAGNYTALLVQLHDVFNGAPENFMSTIGGMYTLRSMAAALFAMPDPNHPGKVLGPSWAYVPHASKFKGQWRGISL